MNSKRLIVLFLFVSFSILIVAQDQVFDTKLPIVHLNTNGNNIVDDPRIIAEMGIVWNENGEPGNTTDAPNHFNGNVNIEIRGSSSQMFPKKSFGFELKDEMGQDMDFPLLGMPEEEDWILYAPYSDKTLIRNVLTFTLAEQISDVYTPRCRFVELFINKKYEGVYVLMENIKRDSVRVDIAKLKIDDIDGEELTGGYIVKVDKTTGGSGEGWHSEFRNESGSNTYYQYEYPKSSEIQNQQKEYIQDYIHKFETAVYNEELHPETGYSSYINSESFFDFIIMNELSKNVDGYRLSSFLYKDKNDKLTAGPLWDFNLGYGNADYYHAWETTGLQLYADLGNDYWQNPFWWGKMMTDVYFTHSLRCRWDSLRDNHLSNGNIVATIDSLVSILEEPSIRNFNRWPIIGEYVWPNYYVENSYWEEVYWLEVWLEDRLRWLDFALPGDCGTDPSDIKPFYNEAVNVFPNPFTSNITLNIVSNTNLSYRLELFSVNGEKVLEENYSVVKGGNLVLINTEYLQGGIYIYRLFKGNTPIAVEKIVKL